MWVATLTGIAGSIFLALNIGLEFWGFLSFSICSVILALYAHIQKEYSLLMLQCVYIVANTIGLIRFS